MADLTLVDAAKAFGGAAAAFLASYATTHRTVKRRLEEPTETLGRVKQRQDDFDKTLTEIKDSLKRIEERLLHAVSDEEFSVYTQHTSAALTTLTEKLGHAAGAIEAWYRTQ